jgi:DNA polymerase V
MPQRQVLCIDLKSFYASVECVERGLDPMTTDLVVADPERGGGTICLAVSPSLKAKGVKNRCRVFEIPKGMAYIMAPPRMQKYIDYAAEIYRIYLRYLAPEDIYVYSIDECFLDVTPYLRRMGMTGRDMALFLMGKIREELGLRSAAGVGTNLYLAKIALDITAKHAADFIGELDEDSFRRTLWDHRPLTDFWRIGPGTARHLGRMGVYTQRQITEASEDRLYQEFGIDAELLIDHAWGREPTTLADIHRYQPRSRSITSGQVLWRDYSFEEGKIILKEMLDLMCLELVEQGLVTESVSVMVGYSHSLHVEPVSGTAHLDLETNADRVIIPAVLAVYERITDPQKPIRRFNFSCNDLRMDLGGQQFSLFSSVDGDTLTRNRKLQQAVIGIRKKYGKNAMLKGMNFDPAATTRERNRQIGGHKSGV